MLIVKQYFRGFIYWIPMWINCNDIAVVAARAH